MVKNRQVSERSKHIDVAYHYIRDLQRQGRIDVDYIPTDDMIADGLTTPLAKEKFQRYLKLIGMTNQGECSRKPDDVTETI